MPSGVTLAVVGAGDRGTGHARWALAHPERATVVAVAEPRTVRRDRFAAAHGLDAGAAVDDWRVLAARGRVADAVLICTLDREHLEPVLAFAALGYHIMLEKPMALTEEECRRIVAAVEEAGVILSVGHVLRYTPTRRRSNASSTPAGSETSSASSTWNRSGSGTRPTPSCAATGAARTRPPPC
ncbi:Gfo/Idh/MocA family oxidoreductase [Streptomyces sp. NBC_00162]|uniref:Gfo/Idh/MocA family protein n=1 Tax=Streptomyces sp. NBC_00162 TaxID=2903629 RepID=UPI002AFE58D3|nr:Gfo/Idh/MocA family oxidoreductase [Streptomyces sp. NBC_00162]